MKTYIAKYKASNMWTNYSGEIEFQTESDDDWEIRAKAKRLAKREVGEGLLIEIKELIYPY